MRKAEIVKKLDYLVEARSMAVNLFDTAQKLKRVIENATNRGTGCDAADRVLVDHVEQSQYWAISRD